MFFKSIRFLLFVISIFLIQSNGLAQQASAEFISSLQPGLLESGERVKDGIQNLFYKDGRLYVSNVWVGLQILDVRDVSQPKELGNYRPEHRSHNVFVQDDYGYLSNELSGVVILNIADPSAIKQAGKIRTKGDAYWVVADYPMVYVAEESQGINIYDITDIANPQHMGSFDTPGWAWGLELDGTTLYVADKSGGLLILDVSDPANPARVGQYKTMKNAKTVQVEEGTAYIANGADGLFIIDVSNPQFPQLQSSIKTDGYIYSAYKSGTSIFLANETKKRVEIINVSDLSNPVKEGHYQAEGKVYAAIKQDVYVYVAADVETLILRHNHPPVIAAIEHQAINEVITFTVTPQSSDPDGDMIFFTVKNLPQGAEFDSLSGLITWTPTYEQSGNYPGVTITAIERTATSLSASQTFDIVVHHVNRNPSIPDVADTLIVEHQTLTFTIPAGADEDVEDKGRLTYSAGNLPQGAEFNKENRVFTWTPSYEQSGVYVVDFGVHDPAGGVARDAFTISINHVDRNPVLEKVSPQMVNENTLLTFQLKGSDPDQEDQNALSYEAKKLPKGAVFDPATATLTWTPTYDQSGVYEKAVFVFKAGTLSDSIEVDFTVNHMNRQPLLDDVAHQTVEENKPLKVRISGSDLDTEDSGKLIYSAENLPTGAQFNADSLFVTWTPSYEQSGLHENITFIVRDPSGLVESKSMNITVNHVNRSPVLLEVEAKTVAENTAITFNLSGSDPDREDEGKLQYTADGLPDGASLQGTTFIWTPTYDQSGTYPISFTVSDGRLSHTQRTTVTVTHINRPPVLAETQAQTVNENAPLVFSVSASDPDGEDEGKLRIIAADLPPGAVFDTTNWKINWTPAFDQSGDYTFKFTTSDPVGLTYEKTVKVSVNHINRTPVLPDQLPQTIDENAPLLFTLKPAEDPDAEDEGKIVYKAENLPQEAEFDAQHLTLSWTPAYDQSGEYTVNFSAADAEFTVNKPLKITVAHINRPPQITQPADQIIDENKPWTLKVEFSDPDAEDAGKVTMAAANLPEGAVFDAANATFAWTPGFVQSAVYANISVTATDANGLTDTKNFQITVNHINRLPTLEPMTAVTAPENTPVTITLKASDPDQEDEGKLTYQAQNLPAGAALDPKTGVLTWQPNFLQAGTHTIIFRVTDSENGVAEQTAAITVEDLNRTPALAEISAKTAAENSDISFKVEGSDEDTDNTLVYSAENLPDGAKFDAATQTFFWRPGFEQAGSYNVTFKITDGKEEALTSTQITVENLNRPPKFESLADETVDEDDELSFTVSPADDDEGAQLTVTAANLPAGAVFDASSNTLTWKPDFNQAGDYTVSFTVNDGETAVSHDVKITVKNTNRKPSVSGPSSGEVEAGNNISLSYSAEDPDGGDLSFSGDLPSGASLDSNSGSFSWTPGDDQAGSHTITVRVSDGDDETEMETTIMVTARPLPEPEPEPAPADTTGSD